MMFRLREKLKYMVLGGLLTLAGFMFGNMNNNTEAQLGSQTIGELTVRTLLVLDKIIVQRGQEVRVIISSNLNGGQVATFGPDGKAVAGIGIDEHGGSVVTSDVTGKSAVDISSDENGGAVSIFSRDEKSGVLLRIENGVGVVMATDRFGNMNKLD